MCSEAPDLYGRTGQAACYAKYRPTYPPELYEVLMACLPESHRSGGQWSLAVDVGCGSGQATSTLATYFKKVVGVDKSLEQISRAKAPKKDEGCGVVEYVQGSAYDLNFAQDSSVDLVTCAQMAHWLDLEKFFPEAARVLKPQGALAFLGYEINLRFDAPQAQAAFDSYVKDVLGLDKKPGDPRCYFDCDPHLVDSAWETLQTTGAGFGPLFQGPNESGLGRFQRLLFPVTVQQSVEDLLGYLRSWSPYRTYMERKPGGDPLDPLPNKMGFQKSDEVFSVTYVFFLLTARKAGRLSH